LISTGNDIIDLTAIDVHRTRQERFYSKFLSISEADGRLYNSLGNLPFENFVWLLWSVKEAVYKFSKRCFPRIVFSPKKIITRQISIPSVKNFPLMERKEIENVSLIKEECYCCIINTEIGQYYSRSKVDNEIIFTIVNDTENFDDIWWGIKYISEVDPTHQSETVRGFALKKFKEIYPNTKIAISKNPVGYPTLEVNENAMKIPLSFTHHFRFVGYAFAYNSKMIGKHIF
jgi:phosphopantetheinyl transferase (holo-ACP synthase)